LAHKKPNIDVFGFSFWNRLTRLDEYATIGLADLNGQQKEGNTIVPTVVQVKPPARGKSARKGDFKVSVTGKVVQNINIALNGIIPFPVKVYSPYNASEGSGARLACPSCKGFISQPRQCTTAKCEYEGVLPEHVSPIKLIVEGDKAIVLNDEDMEFLDLETRDNYVIEGVVKFAQVEELLAYADKTYYLAPATATAAMLYAGVLSNLKKTKRCFIGKYTLRSSREILGIIRPFGGNLIVQNVPFASIRRPLPQWEVPALKDSDHDTIERVLSELPQTFEYNAVRDEYGAALTKLVKDTLTELESKGAKKRTKKKYVPVIDEATDDRGTIEAMFASLEASSRRSSVRFESGT